MIYMNIINCTMNFAILHIMNQVESMHMSNCLIRVVEVKLLHFIILALHLLEVHALFMSSGHLMLHLTMYPSFTPYTSLSNTLFSFLMELLAGAKVCAHFRNGLSENT